MQCMLWHTNNEIKPVRNETKKGGIGIRRSTTNFGRTTRRLGTSRKEATPRKGHVDATRDKDDGRSPERSTSPVPYEKGRKQPRIKCWNSAGGGGRSTHRAPPTTATHGRRSPRPCTEQGRLTRCGERRGCTDPRTAVPPHICRVPRRLRLRLLPVMSLVASKPSRLPVPCVPVVLVNPRSRQCLMCVHGWVPMCCRRTKG